MSSFTSNERASQAAKVRRASKELSWVDTGVDKWVAVCLAIHGAAIMGIIGMLAGGH